MCEELNDAQFRHTQFIVYMTIVGGEMSHHPALYGLPVEKLLARRFPPTGPQSNIALHIRQAISDFMEHATEEDWAQIRVDFPTLKENTPDAVAVAIADKLSAEDKENP